jgi:hypothetical protein
MQTISPPERRTNRADSKQSAAEKLFHQLKYAVTVLASAIALYFLLETIFAFGHIGEEPQVTVQPYIGFGHRPCQAYTFRQEGYSRGYFNALGARAKGEIAPKKPGVIRVVMLGDSTTEGAGVPEELTFVKLLESKLNHRYGAGKFEILNFACGGYGTLQEYYQYLHRIKGLHPDIVALVYHQGDVEDSILDKGVNDYLPRPFCRLDSEGNLLTDWSQYLEFVNGAAGKSFNSNTELKIKSRVAAVCLKLFKQLEADPIFCWLQAAKEKAFIKVCRCLHIRVLEPSRASSASLQLAEQTICKKEVLQELESVVFTPGKPHDEWSRVIRWNEERLLLACGIVHTMVHNCRLDGSKFVFLALPAAPDNGLFIRQMHVMKRLAQKDEFLFVDTNEQFDRLSQEQKQDNSFNIGHHLKAKGHQFVADIVEPQFEEFLNKQPELLSH